MILRQATDIDKLLFYGIVEVPHDLYVIDNGSGAIAIGGVVWLDDGAFVVSWARDEAKIHPRVLFKAGRMIVNGAAKLGIPLYAKRDAEEPTSARFLAHMGFERLNEDLYVYRG